MFIPLIECRGDDLAHPDRQLRPRQLADVVVGEGLQNDGLEPLEVGRQVRTLVAATRPLGLLWLSRAVSPWNCSHFAALPSSR